MQQGKAVTPKRILYYDALEVLAIYLVMSVHSVWLNGNVFSSISMSIPPLAVPLFFMVHGTLLLGKDFSPKKHFSRTLKVFLQLIAWSIIYLVVSILFGWIKEEISIGYLYRYFFQGGSINGTLGSHLWFIYALLSIYLFYPVLSALRSNRKALVYLTGILFLFTFVAKEIDVWGAFLSQILLGKEFSCKWWNNILSPFGKYANCLFFFLFGYLLANWLAEKKAKHTLKKRTVVSCALVLSGVLLMMLERKFEFGSFQYNWKPLSEQYVRLGTVLMATGVFALFSAIPFHEEKCKAIVEISKHTIDIYFIHVIVARLMYVYLFKQSMAGVISNYVRALFVLAISYAIGQIMRKIPVVNKLL